MTLQVSQMAQEVFAYVGRPSEKQLPLRDILDVGSRKINSLILDIFNTDRDYRVSLQSLTFTTRDSLLTFDGEVVRLEARTKGSTSDDDWETWGKDSYGAWKDVYPQRRFAFYSTAATERNAEQRRAVFSEDPSPYEFRLMVEQGGVRLGDLTDSTTLSNLVQPLLFTRWALECGAMVNDDSDRFERMWARKERHLRLELPKLEQQWQRYLEGGRGEGVSIREPFNSRRGETEDYYVDGAGMFRST